jgi:Family of unknown function (DUF6065)
MPKLAIYQIEKAPLTIRAAESGRQWMDETDERFAYRCLPLSIANASGWELLSPCRFEASWNGGITKEDLTMRALDGFPNLGRYVVSHFGHGVLTFHTGYLFKTDPEWGLWVKGPPNLPKDSIQALEALVETNWLNFTFTMNWMFTRPSTIVFEKDEPFCFVFPIEHHKLEGIEPFIDDIEKHPDVFQEYRDWGSKRKEFIERLDQRDPAAVSAGWQRWYMQGVSSTGADAPSHRPKRRLRPPKRAAPK